MPHGMTAPFDAMSHRPSSALGVLNEFHLSSHRCGADRGLHDFCGVDRVGQGRPRRQRVGGYGCSPATETTHCKVTERWSVAMKFKLSKKITLTFWAAVLSKNLIAYCYLAQRMTVAKNTYIKIAINGVGPYKAGKSVTRLVRLSHMCVKAYVQLFKMDDKGVHTYWRKAPTEGQCR